MTTNDHLHEGGWRKEPELVAAIMKLWNSEKSQQQIADILGQGLTRNKVGGVIQRNRNLSTRAMRQPVGQAKPRKPRKTAVRVPTKREDQNTAFRDQFKLDHPEYFTPPADAMAYFFGQVEAVQAVRTNQCRFPLGLPDSFCFCQHDRSRGFYCAEHAERVYRGRSALNAEELYRDRRRGRGGVFGTMQKRGGAVGN